MGEACPRCGATNEVGWRFCASCGASNPTPAVRVPVSVPLSPPSFPPLSWSDPYFQSNRREIDRTKTGVLLLIVGSLLTWVPVISLIGGILVLVGVILVILGRRAFGPTHSRNVVLSVVLFLVGIVVVIFLGIVVGLSIASASLPGGGPPSAETIRGAFSTLLWGSFLATVVTNLCYVLFTYALQKNLGKILLWLGYAASVAIQFAIIYVVAPLVDQALATAFLGGGFDPAPILAAVNQLNFWNVLTVVPSVMFAAAYYLVWKRIEKGEIPERPETRPMMPAAPLPPQA